MKEHDATEIAFKNGYKKGVEDVFKEIDKLHLHVSSQHDAIRYAELKKKYTEGNEK